eukprot:m51a1_g3873 putative copper-transporting atpase ran1-like (212) ;mRNA; r:445994-447236
MKDHNVLNRRTQNKMQRLIDQITSAASGLHVPAQQQDQIIKGLKAARAKLKDKIIMNKTEQLRVTNDLHKQQVLIATLKSQNKGLKKQLELLKSENANWREYESLKGSNTTSGSMLSSESIPIEKNVSSKVISTMLNLNSIFHVRATAVRGQSFLSQIITFVKNAQMSRAHTCPARTPANTRPGSIPMALATALAVYKLSSVIIQHWMPRR